MADEKPKKRLLSRFELILLLIGVIILLYFILKGVGLDPVQRTEDTEMVDPYTR